ncbi:uncharacterized protein LOC144799862 isoform X2 [Lissotriton helveticus]
MLFSLRKNAEFQKPEVWQDTAGSSGTSGTTAGKDLPGHRTGGKNQTLAERNQRFLSAQIRPHQARRTNIQRRKRGEIITRVIGKVGCPPESWKKRERASERFGVKGSRRQGVLARNRRHIVRSQLG